MITASRPALPNLGLGIGQGLGECRLKWREVWVPLGLVMRWETLPQLDLDQKSLTLKIERQGWEQMWQD